MDVKIESSWKEVLVDEFKKEYFESLTEFVHQEYRTQKIYPPAKLIFNAFDQCPFDQVKVVILGQDPYHGPGQAHGLCFSVNDDIRVYAISLKSCSKMWERKFHKRETLRVGHSKASCF